jgi:hypothetical protein
MLEASEPQNTVQFPRLIAKFDLAPRSTCKVGFAYWTKREPPYSDDGTITIAGPFGGLNGNVLKLAMGSIVRLQITNSELHPQEIRCRLSVADRSLVAQRC